MLHPQPHLGAIVVRERLRRDEARPPGSSRRTVFGPCANPWDIGAIAAFFALSNRLANVAGIPPNDEFYLMGRVPKG